MRGLLAANFEALAATESDLSPDLHYSIESVASKGFLFIEREQPALDAADPCALLYVVEKSITVELQRMRPDLLFLHAAALDWRGKACLLVAESGRGKSTTTWGLVHHEFGYLTDELSPIDLHSMRVFPYPHALCLKRAPSAPYSLPGDAIHLGRTIHVPTRALPSTVVSKPRPVGAVFLVSYHPELSAPSVRRIGAAEASVRLYANTLNALAHPNYGLDAVVHIAERVPCFTVSSAELGATCRVIRLAVEHAVTDRL